MFFHGRKGIAWITVLFSVSVAVATEPEAVPGQFVVTVKETQMKSTMQIFASDSQVKVLKVIDSANALLVQRNAAENRATAIKALKRNPNVRLAEPNFIYKINSLPNDPDLNQLWGLINIGQSDSSDQTGMAGMDVGAAKAWDIETGSRDVIVAVIDTGIETSIDDLKDNLWVNEAEKNGVEGVDDDNNGFVDDIHGYNFVEKSGNLIDDNGHGSHCAGTVGAKGNNGKGVVGVAWNVRLMGLKFLSGAGGGTLADAISAIDYATLNGAHIMSNSWGGGGFSETLKESIERASAAGIVFIAAAGNERNDNDSRASYPASYDLPNIISVAAIDNKGTLASFSNWGKTKVHVAAPGVNVVSTTPDGLKSFSGTSMACPHVSGIAALLLSKFPNMTVAELKKRIIETSRPLAGLKNRMVGGVANAYNALTGTIPPPDPNDPDLWDSMVTSVSTPHPYVENFEENYKVSFPGAKKISVFFSKFETEGSFDTVTILDKAGNQVARISGNHTGSWSPVVEGDEIHLRFKSDRSINRYGFDVSKVGFKLD